MLLHRAYVHIGLDLLRQALGLPVTCSVVGIDQRIRDFGLGVDLAIEDPNLKPVHEGQCLPEITYALTRDENGRMQFVKYEF